MTTEVDSRITHLRDELGLSQRDLAGALEVRQATISAWETGRAEPSRGNLRLLADLCHDSRAVYRWLLGNGPRPRLQPYREKREERSDPAATYGFEDETVPDLQATTDKLVEALEASRRLAGELERGITGSDPGSSRLMRQAVVTVNRALDTAYHALTVAREALREEQRGSDGG